MARIILEDEEGTQVVIETNAYDHSEGVSPEGKIFRRFGPPINLSGERWDEEDGPTWWRK